MAGRCHCIVVLKLHANQAREMPVRTVLHWLIPGLTRGAGVGHGLVRAGLAPEAPGRPLLAVGEPEGGGERVEVEGLDP